MRSIYRPNGLEVSLAQQSPFGKSFHGIPNATFQSRTHRKSIQEWTPHRSPVLGNIIL